MMTQMHVNRRDFAFAAAAVLAAIPAQRGALAQDEIPTTGARRPGPIVAVASGSGVRRGVTPVAIHIAKAGVDAPIETGAIIDGMMQDPTGPRVDGPQGSDIHGLLQERAQRSSALGSRGRGDDRVLQRRLRRHRGSHQGGPLLWRRPPGELRIADCRRRARHHCPRHRASDFSNRSRPQHRRRFVLHVGFISCWGRVSARAG